MVKGGKTHTRIAHRSIEYLKKYGLRENRIKIRAEDE